jgi:hypothetical protein
MERPTLVLTQFNLKPPAHWNVPNRSLDPRWIEYRLELMTQTACKSLAAQTNLEFVHVLFVNPQTGDEHRTRLRSTGLKWPVELIAVEGFDGPQYGELLAERFGGNEWLTIRLDSDDMLGNAYVRAAKEFTEIGVYCFEDGIYFEERHLRGYRRRYRNNPFLFRIAPGGNSILDEGHHVIKVSHSIRTPSPMWMQYHHQSNVSPCYLGTKPIPASSLLQHFDLDPQLLGPDRGVAFTILLRCWLIGRSWLSGIKSSVFRLRRVTGRLLRGQHPRLNPPSSL